MYSTQIKDITTVTWHNLHFILEYYTNEILTTIEKIIVEGEKNLCQDDETFSNKKILLDTKEEVISTVKTLKAMHTVIEHHRRIKR